MDLHDKITLETKTFETIDLLGNVTGNRLVFIRVNSITAKKAGLRRNKRNDVLYIYTIAKPKSRTNLKIRLNFI